jgi:hypothetical protein
MLRTFIFKFIVGIVELVPPTILRRVLKILDYRPSIAERAGYTVFPVGFGSPFPERSQLDLSTMKFKRDLPGIDCSIENSTKYLQKLEKYSAEVAEFLNARSGNLNRWTETFPSTDSGILFAMLRLMKPKHYVEVGCGFSTRCSTAALARNKIEGSDCHSVFIEPYPQSYLTEMTLPGEFLQRKVQKVPLEEFQKLQAGDVLFLDTSHVVKSQNDVEWEFLHIFPLLKPGVIVHVHDIFTPFDYPTEWLLLRGAGDEQYALECVLSCNKSWEVILPLHLVWREKPELLKRVVASDDRPGSFWFRKTLPN